MSSLKVTRIPRLNLIVLSQDKERSFYLASPKSVIFEISTFTFILKFLVDNGYIDPQVLEGILEEYHTDKGDIDGVSV